MKIKDKIQEFIFLDLLLIKKNHLFMEIKHNGLIDVEIMNNFMN